MSFVIKQPLYNRFSLDRQYPMSSSLYHGPPSFNYRPIVSTLKDFTHESPIIEQKFYITYSKLPPHPVIKHNISVEKAYFSPNTSLKFVDNRTNVNESLYYILSAQESQQQAVTSMRGQGVRSVHLHRSKHDEGFGYSLQYSRNYFLVSHIGHDSPAANSGLCLNDVIIAVNQQSTEDMSYDTLTKLVDKDNDVEFLVQPLEEYLRFQYGPKQDEKSTSTLSTDDNGKKRFKASVIKVLRKLKQH
ncbi:unnamed protein product [Rotaria sp. Silwood1]|nr:unnamed protein product [Rotaria sp. Silwood1]